MATFLARVQALSGSVTSTSELDTWLTDGVIDVIHRIRLINPDILYRFAQSASFGSLGYNQATGSDIIDVARGSYASVEVSPSMRFKSADSTSMYYATTRHPKHYRLNGRLYSLPVTTGTYASLSVIKPDSVANTDTGIAYFPTEMHYLVALYAALMNVISKISDITYPSSIVLPVIGEMGDLLALTSTLPTYADVPVVVLPALPASADVDFSGIGTTPAFVSPTSVALPALDLGSALSISTLTVTATPPVLEDFSIDEGTIDSFGTAPIFISPELALPAIPTIEIGSPPVYAEPTKGLNFATGLTTTSTYIDTDEDIDLARAKIEQVNTSIQAFVADSNNSMNQFNEQNTRYQTELQKEIAEAKVAVEAYTTNIQGAIQEFNAQTVAYNALVQKYIQEAANKQKSDVEETNAKLQEYSGKITIYQTEVNYEVQEYTQLVSSEITNWVTNRSNILQKYGIDTDAELKRYSEDLNTAVQDFNSDFQVWAKLIEKAIATYQAETGYDLSLYNSEVQAILGEANINVQIVVAEFTAGINKYRADIEYITSYNGIILNKYRTEAEVYGIESTSIISKYNSELQRVSVENAHLTNLLVQLTMQYEKGFVPYDLGDKK